MNVQRTNLTLVGFVDPDLVDPQEPVGRSSLERHHRDVRPEYHRPEECIVEFKESLLKGFHWSSTLPEKIVSESSVRHN